MHKGVAVPLSQARGGVTAPAALDMSGCLPAAAAGRGSPAASVEGEQDVLLYHVPKSCLLTRCISKREWNDDGRDKLAVGQGVRMRC